MEWLERAQKLKAPRSNRKPQVARLAQEIKNTWYARNSYVKQINTQQPIMQRTDGCIWQPPFLGLNNWNVSPMSICLASTWCSQPCVIKAPLTFERLMRYLCSSAPCYWSKSSMRTSAPLGLLGQSILTLILVRIEPHQNQRAVHRCLWLGGSNAQDDGPCLWALRSQFQRRLSLFTARLDSPDFILEWR